MRNRNQASGGSTTGNAGGIATVLGGTAAVVAAVALLATLSPAQADTFEKVGTTGAQFLKLGPGARAVAMGEAFVAIADDATALYWNPAGVSRIVGSQITLNHASWVADITHQFAGYVFSYRNLPGVFGVSANFMQMDPMDVTTVFRPDGTGETFDAGDRSFGFTYGRAFTDRFSTGLTLHWVQLGLDNRSDVTANGFYVDVGTLYDTGFRGMMIGMTVQNAGPNMTYVDKDFALPILFKAGVSMNVLEEASQAVLGSFEFNHLSDNAERINLGAEYQYKALLPTLLVAARGGYRMNRDEESWTAGFGTRFPTSETARTSVDYAHGERRRSPPRAGSFPGAGAALSVSAHGRDCTDRAPGAARRDDARATLYRLSAPTSRANWERASQ